MRYSPRSRWATHIVWVDFEKQYHVTLKSLGCLCTIADSTVVVDFLATVGGVLATIDYVLPSEIQLSAVPSLRCLFLKLKKGAAAVFATFRNVY